MTAYDAVVLAGGEGRRLGGVDKATLEGAGATFLDHVVAALAGAGTIVVAGPERPTAVPVRFVREEPPGGGPAAGLAAALPLITAELVVVSAVDTPLLDGATVQRLVGAAAGHDGAVLVDGTGQDQPLVAAYRTESLRAVLDGPAAGRSVRSVIRRLALRRLPDDSGVCADADTWEGVELVRRRLRERTDDARGLDG